MIDAYDRVFAGKHTVMVVMAHPDDLDVFCGGTVARLIADGKRVIALKLTAGDKGTGDKSDNLQMMAQTRIAEDNEAMMVFGLAAADSINLRLPDGGIENTQEIIGRIAFNIRQYQPDLIITTNPDLSFIRYAEGRFRVNHRDHRNAGSCVIDAVYPCSRDRAFFPEHFQTAGLQPGRCREFLIVDGWNEQDGVSIDISDFVEIKRRAVRCHISQFDERKVTELIDDYSIKDNAGTFERFLYVNVE